MERNFQIQQELAAKSKVKVEGICMGGQGFETLKVPFGLKQVRHGLKSACYALLEVFSSVRMDFTTETPSPTRPSRCFVATFCDCCLRLSSVSYITVYMETSRQRRLYLLKAREAKRFKSEKMSIVTNVILSIM